MTAGQQEIAGLMYHEVTDDPRTSGFQRAGALPYTLTPSAFGRHLDAIATAPIQPQLVSELPLGTGKGGRHLLLSFDDGGASARYTAEQLEARGWNGHFFIVTARIGERTFLKRSDIKALRDAGHLVGSHSHTHPDIFRALSPQMMVTEWRVSCAILESLLGERCVAASVPGGDISRTVLESVGEAGVRYLFTSEPYLKPERVGATWILGRVSIKSSVSPAMVRDLVAFRGWRRAQLIRRLTGWARALSPALYRQYVRLRTRERHS